MLKKTGLLFLLMFVCLLPVFAAADSVQLGTMTVNTDAESVNLDDAGAYTYDELLVVLDKCQQLKNVEMYAFPVTAAQADEMTARYPGIEFGWTLEIGDHLVRTDVEAFSTLHSSAEPKHHSEDMTALKYCKNLRALDLGHNEITDLSFLYDLPKLRVLILACNRVKDVTPIGSLEELEYLEIFTNVVGDVTPLQNCRHLVDLDIAYNYINSAEPLKEMKQLKRLWMYLSNANDYDHFMNRTAQNALKEALPETHINFQSGATDGGWREHPHYDVIFEMFHTGKYIPFADTFDNN